MTVAVDPAYVWGIDVATQRLDFAFVHRDGSYQVNHVALPDTLRGAKRLSAMFASAKQFANLMGHHFPPLIVYVERPTGRHPNPALDHAAGICLAGVYDGLADLNRFPVDVQLVAVKDWRKRVLGNGNASKPDVAAWAARRGYLDRIDGAEALGVAACAALECGHGPGPTHLIHSDPPEVPCTA